MGKCAVYSVGRMELLAWINRTLGLQLTRIEQVGARVKIANLSQKQRFGPACPTHYQERHCPIFAIASLSMNENSSKAPFTVCSVIKSFFFFCRLRMEPVPASSLRHINQEPSTLPR